MIFNATIFKKYICIEYFTTTIWKCHSLLINRCHKFIDPMLRKITIVTYNHWQNPRSLNDFNIPCPHVSLNYRFTYTCIFMYRFLLPGQKSITKMLLLPNVFFAIFFFHFLLRADYEYFAVLYLIIFHLIDHIFVNIGAFIL